MGIEYEISYIIIDLMNKYFKIIFVIYFRGLLKIILIS